jgi:transcriptional regulator with XRE-family HTH domain
MARDALALRTGAVARLWPVAAPGGERLTMTRRPTRASEQAQAEPDEFLQAVGSRIREARTKAGLTGAEVAEAIGAAKTWVYAVEDGQQNFTIQGLRRLLRALNLDIRDVLPSTPDLAAETARMRHLHQVSSAILMQLGHLTQLLKELQSLTAPAGEVDKRAE